MDDSWVRVVVVVGGLAAAGVAAWILQRRSRRPMRRVEADGLDPGVYFFSSGTCDTCPTARQDLAIRIVPETFTEFAWEDQPAVFEKLGVYAVPATLVVATDGSAVLHSGVPKRLRSVGGP